MTQINSIDQPGSVMLWWRRLARLPLGTLLFSVALGIVAPYSGTIGARVEDVRHGYARVTLSERRRVRNHLRSIHAIAIINLGEIATGLAVLSTISADMRGIVTHIGAEYVKKARGNLTAVAEFDLPAEIDDNMACEVEAELRDQTGEIVARVKATWLIGYKVT